MGSSGLPTMGGGVHELLYVSKRALDGSDTASMIENLWTVQRDGSATTPLTKISAAPGALGFAWSPDGSKLAFSSSQAFDGSSATAGTLNLWIINADGSGAAPLTRLTASHAGASSPTWSPDGTKIAYVSGRALDGSDTANGANGTANVFVMSADGSGSTPLSRATTSHAGGLLPSWSPDGAHILFLSARALDGSDNVITSFDPSNAGYNLWVMNADGSASTHLTSFDLSQAGASGAVWSPDGTRIAFASTGALDGSDRLLPGGQYLCGNVWLASLATMQLTPLTHLTTSGAVAETPSWSPDGKSIAFASRGAFDGSDATSPGGSTNPWIMAADGSNARPLTRLTLVGFDTFGPAAWASDGSAIAYASLRSRSGDDSTNQNSVGNVWLIKPDGSSATPLTSMTATGGDCVAPVWRP